MDLRERLRLALGPAASPRATDGPAMPSAPATTAPDGLPVVAVASDHGTVYVAEEWWPPDHCHGRRRLSDALALEATALSRMLPGLSPRDVGGGAFVDVETTGLAGGTGTHVFLVGVGTFEEDGFRLRQYFLADLSGERAMMAAVGGALEGRRVLVSFNGRHFDLPLLRTRFALSRLAAPADGLPHLDLLFPARRLYRRRLPSCRLAYLETALLGLEREDDVPGWAIPSLYFEYLRRGDARPLRAVFQHNALDILSLVTLLAHLGHLGRAEPPSDARDCLALARWDESERRLSRAAALYRATLHRAPDEDERSQARRRLAYLSRRLGRWEHAARLWRQEVETGGTPAARLEALVELAKLEEHRRRDFAAAEAATRRAISLLEALALRGAAPNPPDLRREALEHRLERLRRRLSTARGAATAPAPASSR